MIARDTRKTSKKRDMNIEKQKIQKSQTMLINVFTFTFCIWKNLYLVSKT